MKYYLGFNKDGYVIIANNFSSPMADTEYEVPDNFDEIEDLDVFRLIDGEIVLDEEKLERRREEERNAPTLMDMMLAKLKEEMNKE